MLSCHYFPRRGEFSLARLTVGGLDSPWRDDDDDHTTQMGEITLSRLSISTSKENKLGQFISIFRTFSQCLKITKNVALWFFNFGISINFCPIKIDLSGNTSFKFSKTCQIEQFLAFIMIFDQ